VLLITAIIGKQQTRWKDLFQLLQLRILRFGFLQDGDVRVGVFPEDKKIQISRTGFGGVMLYGIGASHTEAGSAPQGKFTTAPLS
jgi:hypothetical protein